MSFFCRLTRKHYWCIPHRSADSKLVQVCYECGAERPARELHSETNLERLNRSRPTGTLKVETITSRRAPESSAPRAAHPEPVTVRRVTSRKLVAVK